ncbi:hypothetical protein [Asticcacaulis solisilvae]|uniref:hypothetical protein n=1 Tax=Asticcacaulis solisilvae TaxID=1217274 RepID=UPI003FD8855A
MKFVDEFVFREDRFFIGTETFPGRHYISIPVANPYVEYEEYYKIDDADYRNCPGNVEDLRKIVEKCRARLNDDNLMLKPGRLRGSPV